LSRRGLNPIKIDIISQNVAVLLTGPLLRRFSTAMAETKPSPLLIAPTHGGMARLSGLD